MRIAIDLQSCQSGSRYGGIGRYSMNLAESMIRNSKDHEFHFFLNNKYPDEIEELVSRLCDLVPRPQIHVFSIPSPAAEAMFCSQANAAELLREAYIAKVNPDVLLITSLFEGCSEEIAVSIKKLIKNLPTAVILYDLIPFVEQDKYLTTEATHKHYFRKIDYLKKADLLLSISEFTRSEGMRLLKSDCPNVINISSAPDSKFCSGVTPASEEKSIKEKYGIYCPYVMYVGSFDQRKNQEGLIRAFAKAQQSINQDLQLVLVGNGWDEIYKKLKILANNLGLPDKKIIFTGKVTDSDLLVLYRMCHLFVFPSFSEGFGIPVIEAMSCGIPTICSNATSMPEIIDNKDFMFNPHDEKEMARLMKKGIGDQKFRARLINNSKQRAPLFSWDITGRKALIALESSFQKKQNCAKICFPKLSELLNQIAQGCNRVSDEILVDISNSLDPLYSTRKNVGWITTWNSRCGIAKYSEYLICGKYKNLFILAPENESTLSIDSDNVLRCWKLGYDQLDNLFHEVIKNEIWIVVIQFNYGFFEFDKLSNFIKKLILSGRKAFITIHSTQDPKAENKNLELLKETFTLCDKVFIHTENDKVNITKKQICKNLQVIPQGVYFSKKNNTRKKTSKSFTIATYGFFLPPKGFLELLAAFNILIQNGADVRLLMVNAEYSGAVSKPLIETTKQYVINQKISDRVTLITDFLDEEESLALLQKAHLVVFPYQSGDGSSAAVRMGLASGVPVAVTPLSTFDDLEDAVFRLPGFDSQFIAKGLQEILADEKILTTIKQQGANWKNKRLYPLVSNVFFNLIKA